MPLRRPCCPMMEFIDHAPTPDCCPDKGCCRDERRGPQPAEIGSKTTLQSGGLVLAPTLVPATVLARLVLVPALGSWSTAHFAEEPPGVRRTAPPFLEVFRI